jgi:hypothetical protein
LRGVPPDLSRRGPPSGTTLEHAAVCAGNALFRALSVGTQRSISRDILAQLVSLSVCPLVSKTLHSVLSL